MPAAGHRDTHGPEALSHPASILLLDLSTLAMASPTASMVPPAAPGSVGSAAHTGLFIVGSRGAGAPGRGAAHVRAGTRTGTCMGTLRTFCGGQGVFIYFTVCSAVL